LPSLSLDVFGPDQTRSIHQSDLTEELCIVRFSEHHSIALSRDTVSTYYIYYSVADNQINAWHATDCTA
jgi:hypothetical protein